MSGGSDGRVKVWDLRTGLLVRELSQPAEAVWRVVFEEEKAVILANRGQRTIMEVSQRRSGAGLILGRDVRTDNIRSGHLRLPKRPLQNELDHHRAYLV